MLIAVQLCHDEYADLDDLVTSLSETHSVPAFIEKVKDRLCIFLLDSKADTKKENRVEYELRGQTIYRYRCWIGVIINDSRIRLALASGHYSKLNSRSRSRDPLKCETLNKAPCLKTNATTSNGAF
jgi:hypothetical protein